MVLGLKRVSCFFATLHQLSLSLFLTCYRSDSPSHHSHPADESLCCPSLSDIFSCCVSCTQWFCCCKRCSKKTEKFSKVSYSYLQPIKAEDSIDGDLVSHKKPQPYQSVFQFPQTMQQFPAHPQLPLKPNRMELRQPQMKYTPGGGPERILLPESPFPAPYLYDRGPGLQTPFVEIPPAPIRQQPRAGGSGLEITTATVQRKKRVSRTRVKGSEDRQESSQMDTAAALGEETKLSLEEQKLVEKRKLQGRNASLPIGRISIRRKRRLFSMRCKQFSQADDDEDEPSKGELEKHRSKHRARTVGSSPSQQPSVDPEKYRRCQTPEYVLDGERTLKVAARKENKGLAMRRCKTPDTLISSKDETSAKKKRQSDSPETEGSANMTSSSSPGSKSGQNEEEKETEAAEVTTAPAASSSTKQDSLVTKIISTDGKRRWGSRREKFRRRVPAVTAPAKSEDDDGKRKKLAKSRTLPAHVTSPPSYLTSGDRASSSTVTDDPPMLYFSLYFDIQRRALAVNLMKAENLPQKPANQGSCDPFIMMFLLPNKQEVLQSVIKQRTLNPVFKQVFEFSGILAHDLKNQVLVFRVFDHDR